MADRVRNRRAVRALVLSHEDEALMLRFLNPFGGKDVWLTPGGGIDPGEDDLTALRREVWEETGLRLPNDLPLIWQRVHTYPLRGEQVRQSEDIYFVRVARFAPTSANNPARGEVDIFREFRWWSLDEIRASRELFVPKGFAGLLQQLIANGPPAPPVTLEG
ncbi:MAG: NUDIX domain-containing protein [Gammaproteobacteria bacterium]|nr:NUDIX domain-containing protein [Gammaproteobacteria bacterium]